MKKVIIWVCVSGLFSVALYSQFYGIEDPAASRAILELESKISSLESKLGGGYFGGSLESRISSLESKISSLESELSGGYFGESLESRISSLESKLSGSLENRISSLETSSHYHY